MFPLLAIAYYAFNQMFVVLRLQKEPSLVIGKQPESLPSQQKSQLCSNFFLGLQRGRTQFVLDRTETSDSQEQEISAKKIARPVFWFIIEMMPQQAWPCTKSMHITQRKLIQMVS